MKSLKKQIIVVFILISVSLIASIYGTMQLQLTRMVIPLNISITQKFVDNRTSQINSWFGERLAELRLLADLPTRVAYNQTQFFQETIAVSRYDSDNYLSIRLVTADGISHSPDYPDFSIADRNYYQEMVTHPNLSYTVSHLLSSKEDDRDAVIILYRLSRPLNDGTMYIAAAIPLHKVQSLAHELTLYDGQGSLLGGDSDALKIDPVKELLFTSSIDLLPNWKINYVVPKASLGQSASQMRDYLVLVGIIVSLLLGLLLFYLFRQIIQPLSAIRHTMKAVQQGNRGARSLVQSPQEMVELSQAFNQTLDDVYQKEQQYRLASIKTLQAQIQPHFLYNTLDTIQWQILGGDAEEAVTTIEYLSTFFRKGLNHGAECITVSEELAHVQSYLAIQKIRHEELATVTVRCSPDLGNSLMLHFLLQPLVENALNHGIRPQKRPGEILIDVSKNGQFLRIAIQNSGSPISPTQVDQLNRGSTTGYGILNVRHRLQLFYQGAASLTFTSGERTTATLLLPIWEETDERSLDCG